MSYVQSVLQPGETLVYESRISWTTYILGTPRRGRELRRVLDALDAIGQRWASEDRAGAL